jgi:hypothetical protein
MFVCMIYCWMLCIVKVVYVLWNVIVQHGMVCTVYVLVRFSFLV